MHVLFHSGNLYFIWINDSEIHSCHREKRKVNIPKLFPSKTCPSVNQFRWIWCIQKILDCTLKFIMILYCFKWQNHSNVAKCMKKWEIEHYKQIYITGDIPLLKTLLLVTMTAQRYPPYSISFMSFSELYRNVSSVI